MSPPGFGLFFLFIIYLTSWTWLGSIRVADALPEDLMYKEEEQQHLSFQILGQATFGSDTAHYYTELDVNTTLTEFNTLLRNLDFYHDHMIKVALASGDETLAKISVRTNETWNLIHAEADGVAHDFRFLCELIQLDCDVYQTNRTFRHAKTEAYLRQELGSLPAPGTSVHRIKRSIGEIILGGVSIYTLLETQKLATEVSGIEHNQDLIAAKVNQFWRAMNVEKGNMDKLLAYAQTLASVTSSGIAYQLQLEILILARQRLAILNKWVRDLVTILVEKRMSPTFFEPESIHAAYDQIVEKAASKGLAPVVPASHLAELPMSYVVNGSCITLLAHVYLARENRFRLYKFVDVPLRLKDGNLSRIVTEGKDFLAVDHEGSEYLSMTSDDLATCKIQQDIYLCEQGLTYRAAHPDCLLALFQGKQDLIKDLCLFTPSIDVPSITAVSKDTIYLVSSLNDADRHTMELICSDPESVTSVVVPAKSLQTVPPNCIYSSDRAVFRPSRRFDLKAGYKTTPIPHFNFHWDELKVSSLTAPNLTHLNVDPLVLDPINHKGHMGLLIAVIVGVCLVALGVGVYFLYRELKKTALKTEGHATELGSLAVELGLLKAPPPMPTPSAPPQPAAQAPFTKQLSSAVNVMPPTVYFGSLPFGHVSSMSEVVNAARSAARSANKSRYTDDRVSEMELSPLDRMLEDHS